MTGQPVRITDVILRVTKYVLPFGYQLQCWHGFSLLGQIGSVTKRRVKSGKSIRLRFGWHTICSFLQKCEEDHETGVLFVMRFITLIVGLSSTGEMLRIEDIMSQTTQKPAARWSLASILIDVGMTSPITVQFTFSRFFLAFSLFMVVNSKCLRKMRKLFDRTVGIPWRDLDINGRIRNFEPHANISPIRRHEQVCLGKFLLGVAEFSSYIRKLFIFLHNVEKSQFFNTAGGLLKHRLLGYRIGEIYGKFVGGLIRLKRTIVEWNEYESALNGVYDACGNLDTSSRGDNPDLFSREKPQSGRVVGMYLCIAVRCNTLQVRGSSSFGSCMPMPHQPASRQPIRIIGARPLGWRNVMRWV